MSSINYTLSVISEIVQGKLHGTHPENPVRQLLIDSRKLAGAESSLFFAIKGERHDAHRFIPDLYAHGLRNFVVTTLPQSLYELPEANFILVADTLNALQTLCVHHRKQFSIPVIGITGSNGKTIVKEWLYQLMREEKNIVRSPKSFNSQVGVPLSVWQMNTEHEMALFEAGISRAGEMEKLEKIIKPTTGIFTNIGQAHSENFSSLLEKTKEKLKLFKDVQALIYCKDYPEIHEAVKADEELKDTQLLNWSKKTAANLLIGKITKSATDTEIQGVYNNDFLRIKIPFTDDASVENAIHCWLFMLYSGHENKQIAERMLMLSPVAMRLELKEGINNCSVINDSYNSDLGSLAIALDFLEQQKQHPKKTVILSDILQSGKNEEALYKEVAELLERKHVNRLIGIGEAISRQKNLFNIEKEFYSGTKEFLKEFSNSMVGNETILLKGARVFGFEEINNVLQQKTHETVLEINLNAVAHNLNYFRSILKPETKIMAMVKAFSYGSGSYEIANVLQFHRVDYLAVAYADEGIELRKAGISLPIMVMNPEEQSYDAMIKGHLEPEIYNFRVLGMFEEAVKRNRTEIKQPIPIHIKLDTGMHRLGFHENDLNELLVRVKNNSLLKVQSVFSHLAGSEDPKHDEFTRSQVAQFTKMSDKIRSYFSYDIIRHILNSAGAARFPDAQFEMVRLGIGLYGIGANDTEQKKLQNVSTLRTSISQINSIPAGESVGYGRSEMTQRALQIATIPIGYADGLSRKHGNRRGKVLVNDKFAPIIGNVCMDMCMIDVTDIQAKEGDEVIVFGEKYSIADFAKIMETIPYEVLTNVSRRVKRVYFQE